MKAAEMEEELGSGKARSSTVRWASKTESQIEFKSDSAMELTA